MTNEKDDLEEDIPSDYRPLNPEYIKDKIPTFTSKKLCQMIVCDRYFGYYRDIALACMEELGKRRAAGDTFDFENFISASLAELPKLDFSIPDIGDVLRQVIARKGTK